VPAEYIDQLLAVAEIASVFIGFVALMSVLAADAHGVVRLVAIVVTSSVTMVACVTPTVLRAFGAEAETILRGSAVVFMTFNAAIIVWQFKAVPKFRDAQVQHKVVARIAWALEAPLWGSLLICASGASDMGLGFYFLAVALLIAEIVVFLLDLILEVAQCCEEPSVEEPAAPAIPVSSAPTQLEDPGTLGVESSTPARAAS